MGPSAAGRRPWRVSGTWLARAREVALRDRDQMRRDVAVVVGGMALDALRRPWRFLAVVKTLRAVDERPMIARPPYAPVDPGGATASAPADDAARTPALLAELRTLRDETAALDAGSAAILGRRLLRLRSRPWRLPLLPLVVLHHVLRSGSTPERPAALAPPAAARRRPALTAARPRWQCLAPAWLGEMLAIEGVAPLQTRESPDALLVCLHGASDAALAELATWRPAAPVSSGGSPPAVFWLLGGELDLGWASQLRDGDRVYASDAARVAELTERLGRPVAHLPLAVQPLLHNPIEWWTGGRGIATRYDDSEDVPAELRSMIALARGRDVEERALSAVEACLGAPLPASQVPAWADPDLRRDLIRHARLRGVLRDQTLGARLERIAIDLGLAAGGDGTPLVTVVTSTIRPHRLADVARSFARQTHPRKELVLVVHGPGFRQRDLDALAGELDAPVRVHRAPDHWTLGHCLQLGCDESDGRFVSLMDDDNVYGPRYLEDYVLAMDFSEAGLVGKASHVIRFDELGRMYVCNPGREYRYAKLVGGGRFMLRREVLDRVRWRPMAVMEDAAFSDDCEALGVPMLSADRFHFVRVRGKPGAHTAQVPPAFFFDRSPMQALPPVATAEDLQS